MEFGGGSKRQKNKCLECSAINFSLSPKRPISRCTGSQNVACFDLEPEGGRGSVQFCKKYPKLARWLLAPLDRFENEIATDHL